MLPEADYEMVDFGDSKRKRDDDIRMLLCPWPVQFLATKWIAVWPSAAVAWVRGLPPKRCGVRACLIHECFSAHQGVEDDDMNVICLGGHVVGNAVAWELVPIVLWARFSGAERRQRRLAKVTSLENTAIS